MQIKDMLIRVSLAGFLSFSAPTHAAEWVYKSATDPMTDETVYLASLKSVNTINSNYGDPVHLYLTVTTHPRTGWSMEFSVDKSQISCSLECFATIRFDDAKAESHGMEEVFNVKGSVYRLSNAEKVATGLFAARKVLVELPIFEQGAQLFVFETNVFDYGKFPHKPVDKEQLINAEKERLSKLYLERIKQNWIQPEDVAPNAYAVVSFQIDHSGDIHSVTVLPARVGSPSQNIAFENSVKAALMKSVPLPLSEDDDARRLLHHFSLKFPG